MLGVATLIVVQAVMVGFREEFSARILGSNAHVTVYSETYRDENGNTSRLIPNFDAVTAAVRDIPGVTHAAPMVRGQVMVSAGDRNAGIDLRGERLEDIRALPLVASPEKSFGTDRRSAKRLYRYRLRRCPRAWRRRRGPSLRHFPKRHADRFWRNDAADQ